MDDVGEPLDEKMFGRQTRASRVVDRDSGDAVEPLFARQGKDGWETPTRLDCYVDRRVLTT